MFYHSIINVILTFSELSLLVAMNSICRQLNRFHLLLLVEYKSVFLSNYGTLTFANQGRLFICWNNRPSPSIFKWMPHSYWLPPLSCGAASIDVHMEMLVNSFVLVETVAEMSRCSSVSQVPQQCCQCMNVCVYDYKLNNYRLACVCARTHLIPGRTVLTGHSTVTIQTCLHKQ